MKELINSYQNTNYKIYTPTIVIKIGVENEVLNNLLNSLNASSWAYITAFNPYSKSFSNEENLKRHELLKDKVKDYTFYKGEGVGEDKTWEPEISLLIIGITENQAIEIGKYFEQNAIVIGKLNGLPELKILV